MPSSIYVGLMSGTSVDGVDAVVVDFSGNQPQLLATHSHALPHHLQQHVHALISKPQASLQSIGELDVALANVFADATNTVVAQANKAPEDISAVGSHGQTIWHSVDQNQPFSWQMGDPNRIAKRTKIATVADFRRADIALGGQGAPLVPAFHQTVFQTDHTRIIANIGGIANITVLGDDGVIQGFDTGPGNTLMDAWILRHQEERYDRGGNWAATGQVIPALLERLLAEPYLSQPAPKSTGRELFNISWLDDKVNGEMPADVQATLLELTAISLSNACNNYNAADVVICGGGVHNAHLMQRLQQLNTATVISSQALGVDPDWVEATAFAWLAKAYMDKQPGNVPAVTGAQRATVLGGLYLP